MTNTPRKILVTVYKGDRKADTYLYVREGADLDTVPDTLLELLGSLDKVLTVELHEDRNLAQADVKEVMHKVVDEGYYLQLPPNNSQYVEQQLRDLK